MCTTCESDDANLTTTADGDVCGECVKDYSLCVDCDQMALTEDMTKVDSGAVCRSCMPNYRSCDDCRIYFLETDLNRCGCVTVCDMCDENYARCDCCNDWTTREEMSYVETSELDVCAHCYEHYHSVCSTCERVFHEDDIVAGGRCRSCNESYKGPILDYGDDYDLDFMGNPKDGVYFGIELEVEAKDHRGNAAIDVVEALGDDFCVCMHDGSLADSGFEIISAPATVDVHYKRWEPLLDSHKGLESWDGENCGMHVHASRGPLSKLTILKALVFINEPVNREFVERVAGRAANSYCESSKKTAYNLMYPGSRYQSINLENAETIEFRIFKGTLNKRSFFKNLEFVAATLAFCKGAGLQGLTVPEFLAHVASRRKEYPNLASWLVDKSYLAPKKGKKACA